MPMVTPHIATAESQSARKRAHPCMTIPARFLFLALLALYLTSAAAAATSGHATLFALQQHKFNGSLFKHGGNPVSLDHLSHLQWRDSKRRSRVLSEADPVSFRLGGIADPNIAGLYFTEIQLGNPPSKYYVQVDTGSDLLWVNCANCRTCSRTTDLGVHLALYDPGASSTSSRVLCGDNYCNAASSGCLAEEACVYQLGYGDGSSSEGFFVRDSLQLNIVAKNSSINASAIVAFGCGTRQGGELRSSDQALDGILGFGQSSLSIISQLRSKNEAPGVFAHCLENDGEGGGILVIGKVQAPGLVYTPILQNTPHYNVDLKSISVKDVSIPIDSSASPNGGTIVDSGTTLTYLSDAAYEPLLKAIFDAMPVGTSRFRWQGMICVPYTESVDEVFPTVTFTFDGDGAGSDMIIRPLEYLIQVEGQPGQGWCIGFQTTGSSALNLNILGDLVLKDRLVVYDLEQQRIGWVDYDCGSNVTVLSSTGQRTNVLSSTIPMGSAGYSMYLRKALGEYRQMLVSGSICFLHHQFSRVACEVTQTRVTQISYGNCLNIWQGYDHRRGRQRT
ncbi:hypothetical protein GOP47_0018106 [Adiantum capillus-veneris]|uniref:Peptidase A1 domain-containing protein n=1 Tax=Adiantum capillus-veneris TaxID=13818 RepID=A0A9D4UHL7_ADICA|nr:hypothetical protein GOP47_0018106 [Adiantum capillus-veneris]